MGRAPARGVHRSRPRLAGDVGPVDRQGSARTQPPGRRPGPPSGPADRVHRDLGIRQVVAGLRHHLCRGTASLRGVAVGLRQAVPGPDRQARRGLHPGTLTGHLHRPEERLAQPPFHGRHHHRGVRLPATPLRPNRPAPRPRDRRAPGPPDTPTDRGPGSGDGGGHPVPGAGTGRAGAEGHLRHPVVRPGSPGLQPGHRGRRTPRARRRRGPGPLRDAHHSGGGGPPGAARRVGATPHRVDGDGAGPHRGSGRDSGGPPGRRRRRGRPAGRTQDHRVQPAPLPTQ